MATEFDKNWESMQPTIFTANSNETIDSSESKEEQIWHELRNAYVVHRILPAVLSGYEETDAGGIAVVYYKEHRVIIPMEEMELNLEEVEGYGDMEKRKIRIINNMIGCEIDFVIIALDNDEKKVVGSRRLAMRAKRKHFYFPNDEGLTRVKEGTVVQARVIAVAEKSIRVDVLGAECAIIARDLSWDWLGDARERFYIGEKILVVVTSIELHKKTWTVKITADVKSLLKNDLLEKLKECKVKGTYSGQVSDIHKGVVFIQLDMGVNAIAHTCKDYRMPGKKDRVTFVVTHIDKENAVAVGLITRITQQNIRG